MSSITINAVTFTTPPASVQVATVKHRLTSDADVSGSYTTDSTSVNINTDGTLPTPLVISGLVPGTSYTIWIITDCASFKKVKTTPAPVCSDISDITATVS